MIVANRRSLFRGEGSKIASRRGQFQSVIREFPAELSAVCPLPTCRRVTTFRPAVPPVVVKVFLPMRRGKCLASTFRRWRCPAALVLALGLAAPVYAQFDSGQISGFVRDAQGGVIPGATVRVVTRGHRRSSATYTTDTSGYYVGARAAAGEVPGGGRARRVQEVRPDRRHARRRRQGVQADAVLSPGGIEEAVTVMAEATPLQTNTGQVAKTIESQADPGPDAQRPQPDQPGPAQARACAAGPAAPSTASSPTA